MASMTAAPSTRRAVEWFLMTSSVPEARPDRPGERLAVTGELTDLCQHVVQGETLLAPRWLAEAVGIGEQRVGQRLAVNPLAAAAAAHLERALHEPADGQELLLALQTLAVQEQDVVGARDQLGPADNERR